jgi:hypothetical protein
MAVGPSVIGPPLVHQASGDPIFPPTCTWDRFGPGSRQTWKATKALLLSRRCVPNPKGSPAPSCFIIGWINVSPRFFQLTHSLQLARRCLQL